MNGFIGGLAQDYAADYSMEKYDEYMGAKFQPVKDPYYMELSNGKQIRRKLPAFCTKKESKAWKKLQNQAWRHDKCFMGCVWLDWGIGWGPILSVIPVVGPLLMYWVHSKLIRFASKKFELSDELKMKMHANIVFDLLITLPPVIGTFLTWMNACSTRNCAMVYNYVCKQSLYRYEQEKQMGLHPPVEVRTQQGPPPPPTKPRPPRDRYQNSSRH